MTDTKKWPDVKDYTSSTGETLRELFALAVLRALSPMERASVIRQFESAK